VNPKEEEGKILDSKKKKKKKSPPTFLSLDDKP
jgi:hypothetical protein